MPEDDVVEETTEDLDPDGQRREAGDTGEPDAAPESDATEAGPAFPEGTGLETSAGEGCPGCCGGEDGEVCPLRGGDTALESGTTGGNGSAAEGAGGEDAHHTAEGSTGETPAPPAFAGASASKPGGDTGLEAGATAKGGIESPPLAEGEEVWPAAGVKVAGLCFRKGGKVYYFHSGDFPLASGDFVVVETDRGVDIGEVVALKTRLEPGQEEPTKRLLRPATPGDVRRKRSLETKQEQAFKACEGKIAEHKLDMKLIDASYTLDGKRLTFSFVSEGRVDFRDLVRDLAQTFRCRIELRQVGVRDQAKLIGGLGPCGRPLCCATFLRDFCSVGIRLAKDQGLSLSPAKISGACDRLMCCLRYEHAQYAELNRRLPRMGERVEHGAVAGEVIGRNLLTGLVTVRTDDGKEAALTEKDLFPEGITVAVRTPQQQRRREDRRPRERKSRRRERQAQAAPEARPSEAPAKPTAPAEPTAKGQSAAPGAKSQEDHRKKGHRHRGPRHRRKRKPSGKAPQGGGAPGGGDKAGGTPGDPAPKQ